MNLAGVERTVEFARKHPTLKTALKRWAEVLEGAVWNNPADMKRTFRSADVVGNQSVFTVGGNKCRLIALVHYKSKRVLIQHVLTRRVRPRELERMTTTVDPEYAKLLEHIQPRVPRDKDESARLLAEAEKLMKKGEANLSPAEDSLLGTLFALIHEYERSKYTHGMKSTPAEVLRFLMEENNLAPSDLPLPASRVSEILSGKREVSKDQAKALAARFRVSPALFI